VEERSGARQLGRYSGGPCSGYPDQDRPGQASGHSPW
jgi:hypothetical protein